MLARARKMERKVFNGKFFRFSFIFFTFQETMMALKTLKIKEYDKNNMRIETNI